MEGKFTSLRIAKGKNNMFSGEINIGILAVLGILIVFLVIIAIKRSRRQQHPGQPLEAANLNAAIDHELLNEGENLIEILGLENLPHERQAEVIEAAREVIDKRCLNHVLESLNEREKNDFINLLEGEDAQTVGNFLKSKNIDMTAILREEVLRFKIESAEELSR